MFIMYVSVRCNLKYVVKPKLFTSLSHNYLVVSGIINIDVQTIVQVKHAFTFDIYSFVDTVRNVVQL